MVEAGLIIGINVMLLLLLILFVLWLFDKKRDKGIMGLLKYAYNHNPKMALNLSEQIINQKEESEMNGAFTLKAKAERVSRSII